MKVRLILFLIIPFVYSCIETLSDEELTITRTHYYGKEFRLDGYYTGLVPGQSVYYNYIFFYSNGVTYYLGHTFVEDINQIKIDVESSRKNKSSWGIFHVKNDTIAIQGWRLRDDVYQNLLINYQYKIINDTTLFYKDSRGDTTCYYFRRFSPKPDSTNVFIKY